MNQRGWIDPAPFWDDDGRAYMVFCLCKEPLRYKTPAVAAGNRFPVPILLTEPRLIFDGEQIAPTSEGPKMYKRNGYYYILMPSGGVETGWQSCLRSRSVYGPYDYRVVMHQGNSGKRPPPGRMGNLRPMEGTGSSISRMWWSWGESSTCSPCVFWMTGRSLARTRNGDGIGEPVREWSVPAGERAAEERTAENGGGRTCEREMAPQEICRNTPSASPMILRKRHGAPVAVAGQSRCWILFPRENPGHLRLYCYRNPGRKNLLCMRPMC